MTDPGCSPILKALSDETRWRIVHTLLHGDRANVNDLVATLKVSQPNVSKHLRVLRNAGIVKSEKEGTVVWCCVTPEFRGSLRGKQQTLDLGCCTFRFDRPRRG